LHGVPHSILKDRLSGKVQHGVKPGPIPYISKEEEFELSTHIVCVVNLGYGKHMQALSAYWRGILFRRMSLKDLLLVMVGGKGFLKEILS